MIPFQIVDVPNQYPGMTIGGSSDGPVVATHYELGECAVFLHRRDIREGAMTGILTAEDFAAVAGTYGGLTASEGKQRDDRILELEAEVASLEGRLADLEPVERAMASAMSRYGTDEPDPAPAPRKKAAA